jgi:hypothetical protein
VGPIEASFDTVPSAFYEDFFRQLGTYVSDAPPQSIFSL